MRYAVVVAALGLWVAPAAANPKLQLDPPTMSARQERCPPRQRDLCEGVAGQRAIDHDLSCSACENSTSSPMPAEIVAPTPGDTPRPTRSLKSPSGANCEPGTTDPDKACPTLPPLDTVPRP
jgi:hypothetical protein